MTTFGTSYLTDPDELAELVKAGYFYCPNLPMIVTGVEPTEEDDGR